MISSLSECKSGLRLICLMLASLLLLTIHTGCSTSGVVPLEDRYRSAKPVTRGFHRVRKGETLFAIAWRYHRDYRQLARTNSIKKPYKIFPGQLISLAKNHKRTPKKHKKKPSVAKPNNSESYKKSPNHAKPIQQRLANQRHKRVLIGWRWPTQGSILKRFVNNRRLQNGITFAGKRGDPVYAAASGVVKYSGPGFPGYGNLIILDHGANYLSAYAHNSRLLVAEGQNVKARQKIAEIGSTGAIRDQLYFEIRKAGEPVDPLKYLPRR